MEVLIVSAIIALLFLGSGWGIDIIYDVKPSRSLFVAIILTGAVLIYAATVNHFHPAPEAPKVQQWTLTIELTH